MGVLPTCEVPEIDALIIYPTLGAPQILPPNPKECTIIIAVDADGYRQFRDPCKGAVLVNHHLRLINLDDDKANLSLDSDPCNHRLYSAIREEHYHPYQQNNKENAKLLRAQYIEINELPLERHPEFSSSGSLMYWYPADVSKPKDKLAQRKLVGCLSPEARSLHGRERFDYYFAVTLKNLGSSKVGPYFGSREPEPRSWAWIVTTSPKNGRKQHHFEGAEAASPPKFHQPLDRLIRNELHVLSRPEHFKSATAGMVELDAQFEIVISGGIPDYTPTPQTEPHRRVQAWHPVVVAKNIQPLKLGHLTDTHVSVRAATIARSRVKVLEGVKGEKDHLKPVGEIVAHTFKSFKALIDKMAEKKADVLAFTGDLTDFNRNINPRKTESVSDTGALWRLFNVHANMHDEKGIYRRHLDQLYVYSLMMYALREKELASFHVSGNHEGYAWPYGISPRVGKVHAIHRDWYTGFESGASAELKEATEAKEHAERNLRLAEDIEPQINSLDEEIKKLKASQSGMQSFLGNGPNKDRIKALEAERSALNDQLHELGGSVKQAKKNEQEAVAWHKRAKEKHEKELTDLQDFQSKQETIDVASEYYQKKATEMLPSDHNLTIYEACLAYGPTYGQTPAGKDNFRSDQFDWLHWLYTPFSDQNLYPCCTDLLGEGANQVVTLLGWGVGERLVKKQNITDFKKGEDRRGFGFLPYATESINPIQLELIKAASDVSKTHSARWSVLSHFVVTSFNDPIPAGIDRKEAGFQPSNDPDESGLNTYGDNNAQFNHFNLGGCERNLKDYLDKYASLGKAPEAGRVNLHLSGHSHRGGIYTLTKVRNRFPGRRDGLEIECRLPNFPGKDGILPGSDKGTLFVVGTTGGPMGKQAINGWSPDKKGWKNTQVGGALLDGWLTRPPSGLLVDTQKDKDNIRYITSGAAAPNEVPRLAIMLDYREIMGVFDENKSARPIVFGHRGSDDKTLFNQKSIAVTISEEVKQLDCLDLQNIKVWVFVPGVAATKTAGDSRTPGAANPASSSKGEWQSYEAWVSSENMLVIADSGLAVLRNALTTPDKSGNPVARKGASIPCSFVAIPLKRPNHDDAPWDEVKYLGESWVFPVDIGVDKKGRGYFHRGEGESGEVPKWEFLAEHLGYPGAREAIDSETA